MKNYIQAGKFKAECLSIMDQVSKTKQSIIVTKRKMPVVKIVPIEQEDIFLYGSMKGTVHILADITQPIDEEWDACR